MRIFALSKLCALAIALATSTSTINAATYHLQDNYIGTGFLGGFNWETFSDPSGGYVNYVDQGTALQRNLTYASGNKFVIRADSTDILPSGSRGRDSIRITSLKSYADSIIVMDLEHMPGGCAQWPAFWTFSPGNWPNGGEIDIIEGIHNQDSNVASLHTADGCYMPDDRRQKGYSPTPNCYINSNSNSGCQTYWTPSTFGQGINQHGGGFVVITRSSSLGVAMYFWPRGDRSVPPEIASGDAQSIDLDDYLRDGGGAPKRWGTPQAFFPASSSCDFNAHFSPHNLVINLSFCGPWAGPRFNSAGCGAGTCEDFVRDNPRAFSDAYWEINSLRVYTR